MPSISEMMLSPLGAIYGAVTRARMALYNSGALTVHNIGVPVISVGNITTGGTGKTPLVEWIARVVAGENRRVCILTRGYGRAHPRNRVVVSDGTKILADAMEGGDEPRLLAEMLEGVAAVVSDRDRVAAARWALENLRSEVFILDDGFQHRRIARNLDIVVLDATNPWGGGHLLPRGRLREPQRSLARADCIIITRSRQAQDLETLRGQTSDMSNGRPIFISRTRTRDERPLLDTMEYGSDDEGFLSEPVAAFCAIGNPQAFFSHLRQEGHTLNFTRSFADHHIYTQTDVKALVDEARSRGAKRLVTTAKDAVKLRQFEFDIPCYVLEIELEFDDEEGLRKLLTETINDK